MQTHRPNASAKLAGPIGVFALAIWFGLTSCGGAQPSPSSAQSVHFPLTIGQPGGRTVTIARQPHRIVSLSSTATEMLFAIAAGPQVIAVDDQSNYPSNVPKTKLSGFTPNIEAIAGYTPDLVVAALMLPVVLAAIDGMARVRRRRYPLGMWVAWVLAGAVPVPRRTGSRR